MMRAPLRLLLCLSLLGLSGCGWQSYLVTRGINHFTGKPTRVHPIVAVNGGLTRYRTVEVKPLENLVLGQIPSPMENYLNRKVSEQLRAVKSRPEVLSFDEALSRADEPALVFEGYIDDYDPGYFGLRLAELGFNHVAVTVRFQLRDSKTGQIVGAASITAQDNRVTASPRGAIDRIAKRIKGFVSSGYGGVQ